MTTAQPRTAATPIDPPFQNTYGGKDERERTPWLLGFLAFLIPIMPAYVVLPGPLKSNGSPARMIAVVLFGLVVLGFALSRRTANTRQVSPGAIVVLVYFLLWLTTYGVGLLYVDSALIASNRTRAIITLCADVGVALYVLSRVKTDRQRSIVLGCLAAGLTFACLVGLLQGLTPIDLRFLFRPPGFALNVEELQLTERLGARRVIGTSQHAIEFSVLAATTVPLTIYFARHAPNRSLRLLAAAAACLALLALPAAISRSGVISLVTVLLIYMLAFTVRQIAIALAVGAVAVVAYAVAFPHVAVALWETITGSERDPSVRARTEDYAEVSQTFREHPVFGLGLGGQPHLLDNEWLQTIVQGGVIGLAAMIVVTGGAVFGMAAGLRRATSPREREQVYMMGAVLAGILVSSTTFDLFYYQQASLIFFIVFGLLWSTFTVPVPEIRGGRPRH
ncbi:O-antigen ligase family protein [Rhodococcus maanshanensis]|uniref:O-antigen ligase n=1 Tax=Rhodococcus maanshanensis TaxID=183556 RepID=A0A1H7ML31_9NOCA|nr:O-antigen ligase family protein [Rhodococcus maanshanensis]SEL11996.1 O-antigen ligase [Rhodococcus maanshanensis]